MADADGVHILSFAQAQEAARSWFAELAENDSGRKITGPCTVKQACDDYVDFLKAERKSADDTDRRLKLHVIPKFGERRVSDLNTAEIEAWKRGMVRRDEDDADAERRSKDTANRVLTMLKAALNRAFADDTKKIPTDIAWRKVKPFRKVGRARQVHLDVAQSKRLINSCGGAFRKLVTAALLTGARPPSGELGTHRLRVDVNGSAACVPWRAMREKARQDPVRYMPPSWGWTATSSIQRAAADVGAIASHVARSARRPTGLCRPALSNEEGPWLMRHRSSSPFRWAMTPI